jgi:hypothetical protein
LGNRITFDLATCIVAVEKIFPGEHSNSDELLLDFDPTFSEGEYFLGSRGFNVCNSHGVVSLRVNPEVWIDPFIG